MKRLGFLLVLVFLLIAANTSLAQNDDGTITVTCDDGGTFDNGVEVTVVQMRAGFSYTATVLGVNEFDPILAVLNDDDQGVCTDDTPDISDYDAELPTAGEIDGQRSNVQIDFNNGRSSGFNNVRLVVGGEENMPGEFILILQGMAVTSADGLGDIFTVRLSEPMIDSGVNVTAYVISVTSALDPLIFLVNGDAERIEDGDGDEVLCDDAGNADLCWGESESLERAFVPLKDGTPLGGYELDAMLSLPLEGIDPNLFFNFIVSSYNNSTAGDYVIVFHIGIGETEGGSTNTSGSSGK